MITHLLGCKAVVTTGLTDIFPSLYVQVRDLCEAAGVALDVSSNRSLAASLAAACSASPQAASLIKSLTTRAMSEAEYCSTGVHLVTHAGTFRHTPAVIALIRPHPSPLLPKGSRDVTFQTLSVLNAFNPVSLHV